MDPEEVIREIYIKASTLADRLSWKLSGEFATDEARVEQWLKIAGKGNFQTFLKRLEWDGISLEQARRALASCEPDQAILPDGWFKTLQDLFEFWSHHVNTATEKARPNFIAPGHPHPFQEFFLPAISFAGKRLKEKPGENIALLSDEGHIGLEQHLLETLLEVSASTLLVEFRRFQVGEAGLIIDNSPEVSDNPASEKYQSFINKLLTGYLSFFLQYPVLARLTVTVVENWIESSAEFIKNLAKDQEKIANLFNGGKPTGKLASVEAGLSDHHRGGRSVMVLAFESGLKLVYKPRDQGLELSYNRLLEWLNENKSPINFKAIKILEGDGYGWVEFVERKNCESLESIKQYYRRFGALLCLLYALGAGDIHFENLLASGEYPVLIDAETLLQPEMPYRSLPGYPEPAKKERSVIDTAMLPFFDRDRKQPYLYSALTASPENITPVLADAWKYPNTDRMVYQQEQIKLPAGNNLPTLEGATANFRIEPLEYLEQVLDGFREMYLFLLEKKDLLLGDESPLEVLAVQPMRFLFRNTRVYGVLLKKLYEPQFLRNGLDRSLELEALARAFVLEESCPPFWSILKAEQEAMEKLDVPFFYTGSSETGLNLPGGEKIKGWFEKSGYQVMRSNLEKLEMQDMERQLLTIREETEAYRKALLL